MKEWLKSLPGKAAEHVIKTILGFLVLLALATLVGSQTGLVGGSPSADHSGATRGDVDSWPDGESAWTVILASEQTRGAAEAAVDRARTVPDRGLSLGVLNSDDYSSLRSGYWVAFAGQFANVEEAQDAADRYRSEFPSAYQRFIEEG